MATQATPVPDAATPVEQPTYKVGVPTETEPNITVPEPVKTDFGFRLKGSGEHVASKKVFDLETLEKKTLYNVYVVNNLESVESLDSIEPARRLALVNLGLQKEQLMQAKSAIAGGNSKTVNDFINQFRFLPNFSKLVADGLEGEAKSKARKTQTAAIVSFIKGIPQLYEQLQEASKSAPEDEDEDEGNEE